MYVEESPPLYISYVSPEQTKYDRHQETLEAEADKNQRFRNVTKVNESKQWKEVFSRNLLSMESLVKLKAL